MVKSKKDMCPFSYWSVVDVIKVRREKDICMGKSQNDIYVLLPIGEEEREIQNAQVNFINIHRQKKVICTVRTLSRLTLKKARKVSWPAVVSLSFKKSENLFLKPAQ